jgi:hypothetical protein
MTGTLVPIFALVLTLALAALALWRARRPVEGLCPKCSYALGPTPELSTCPECGSAPSRVITARVPRGSRWRSALVYLCALLLLALAAYFHPVAGAWIASATHSGPRWVQRADLRAIVQFSPGWREEFSLGAQIERSQWGSDAGEGTVKLRSITLGTFAGPERAPVASITIAYPPGPSDEALREFVRQAAAGARARGLDADESRWLDAVHAVLGPIEKNVGFLDVPVALAHAWFPGGGLGDGTNIRNLPLLPSEPNKAPRARMILPASSLVPSSVESPDFRDALKLWSRVTMAGALAYVILLVTIYRVRNRTLTTPWPPKAAGSSGDTTLA